MSAGGGPEGLLLVDKPSGMTSHDVVDVLRRRLGTRKVGHAGTLDPMATGLLLVGAGRATRLLRFLGELPKTYQGTARLGIETDTLDAQGRVLRTAQVDVARPELEAAIAGLVGDSLQRPPAYSAVKVGGRKLYQAARRGQRLEAPPRPIHVARFELTRYEPPDWDFLVRCSGGTYVRALASEVGSAVGPGAHLVRLVRTAIGPFLLRDAAPPERATPQPIERAVSHLPRLELGPEEARAAGHGSILGPAGMEGPYGVYGPGGELIGVWRDDGAKARPEVVLAGG
ncbi:MAG TPA: tRNA pseudouridine(55) synthase TruB [Actinomycetota bacterium]|jgi:tRNA pseudouridine55 synthase|nr:tRNA pseudouridine(55) synthase TruB [Actinomycetota bacterium]